jgi:hypothetical protein
MLRTAYEKLVDLGSSEWLAEVLPIYRRQVIGQERPLKHLRICFDEDACYEVICEEFSVTEEAISYSNSVAREMRP